MAFLAGDSEDPARNQPWVKELDRILAEQISWFKELFIHQQALQSQIDVLSEQHGILSESLFTSGVITPRCMETQRSRLACTRLVNVCLQTASIVRLLSDAADPDGLCALAATSRSGRAAILSTGRVPHKRAEQAPMSPRLGLLSRIFYFKAAPQATTALTDNSSTDSASGETKESAPETVSDESLSDSSGQALARTEVARVGRVPLSFAKDGVPRRLGLLTRLFYAEPSPCEILVELPSQVIPMLGIAVGVATTRQLGAVSKSFSELLKEVHAMLEANREAAIYVCGGSIACVHASAERFDPALGVWEQLPPMSTPRNACAMASHAGLLYVIGGCAEGFVDVTERYNPDARQWEVLPGMQMSTTHGAAAAASSCIYSFGGLSRGKVVQEVQQFNTVRCEWKYMTRLETPRFECAALTVQGHLYVVGGASSNGEALVACDRLDPTTDEWTKLPNMITARHGCAAAHSKGMIFVCGGGDDSGLHGDVEILDLDRQIWVPIEPMPVSRKCCGVVAVAERIYVFGGITDLGQLPAAVHCFDPTTCIWEEKTPMPTLRSYCCAVSTLP